MKFITENDAIKRLKIFCRNNRYTIVTEDFTGKSLEDEILQMNLTNQVSDNYTVYGTYNGSSMIIAEGALIEMMYDFKLLNSSESLQLGLLDNGITIAQRKTSVRVPWSRSS